MLLKAIKEELKIRIVPAELRGEESFAALCRREGAAEALYDFWSKECLKPMTVTVLSLHCETKTLALMVALPAKSVDTFEFVQTAPLDSFREMNRVFWILATCSF